MTAPSPRRTYSRTWQKCSSKKHSNWLNWARQLDTYIEEQGLSSQLETTLNNHQLLITFSDTALYDPASADLKPEAQALARSIGDMLAGYPEYEIMISGHTDNVPKSIRSLPFELGAEHDASRELYEDFTGIGYRSCVSSAGFGEYRPVADNDTVEGRAANRRVEVSIMRNFLSSQLTEEFLNLN